MNSRQSGVTIVELLIVMVIIAVLAAIAFPAYDSQQRRSTRAAAQSQMVNIANRQAQFLLDARNYALGAGALAALNVALPNEVVSFYAVTVENDVGGTAPTTPPTFTIKATPIAGTRQAVDGELTLTHTGAKTRAGNPGW